ncbi:MAG: nucleotidyltransferase domain-containing protein [Candidatus Omnitrophica bacterium]|nr:nucleotidyltransferase domain-containing protein [Candidatus Omnitrophota bacterium]
MTTHAALRELYEATLLDFKKVGNSFLYSLRDEHYLIREVLRPLFHRESVVLDRLLDLLKRNLEARLWPGIVTIAVYGSVARRQERSDSDIDLLVLVKSKELQRRVRQALNGLGEAAEKEFGNPLAPYVSTIRGARQKHRRRLPLFKNILVSHRLVWGVSLQEVLGGRPA